MDFGIRDHPAHCALFDCTNLANRALLFIVGMGSTTTKCLLYGDLHTSIHHPPAACTTTEILERNASIEMTIEMRRHSGTQCCSVGTRMMEWVCFIICCVAIAPIVSPTGAIENSDEEYVSERDMDSDHEPHPSPIVIESDSDAGVHPMIPAIVSVFAMCFTEAVPDPQVVVQNGMFDADENDVGTENHDNNKPSEDERMCNSNTFHFSHVTFAHQTVCRSLIMTMMLKICQTAVCPRPVCCSFHVTRVSFHMVTNQISFLSCWRC